MTTPNPGSNAARDQGCICPVLDNNHGKYPGYWGDWIYNAACPLHGVAALLRDEAALGAEEATDAAR